MHTISSPTNSRRPSLGKKIISFAFNTGLIRVGRGIWKKSLTVLNYHRIDDPYRKGIDSFQPNISAHPDEFKRQMEYLDRWFNVVSVREVASWLEGKASLPDFAALITFDDGYLDNYINAYPILRQYNFPAVIYLAAGHIDTDKPFYWDLAAYCFTHTKKDHVAFPGGTERSWGTSDELLQISKEWIEAMKILPETEKQGWASRLPEELNISIPKNFFKNLMMNWGQVREMHGNGIDFGGHTINHPILTRIAPEAARTEIAGSKVQIERELGETITSFAYPNGMKADVNSQIEKITAESGFKTAFTLQNGPATLRETRQNPYAIRRSFISHKHTLAHFSTLISPFNRIRPT